VSLDGYGPDDVERIGADGDDEDPRPPFARDYDRLIYSSAFRRLQGKTQVVSPGEADFFRTRLTHTIEVAQVARRLAEDLNRRADAKRAEAGKVSGWIPEPSEWWDLQPDQHKIDPDLCESAAILHDLGHPPFGHAGEEALDHFVRGLTGARECRPDERIWEGTTPSGFNGNAQSFRLATATLEHKQGSPGLRLTRATLDASLKYPWEFGSDKSTKSHSRWNVDAPQVGVFVDDVRKDVPDELRHELTVEAQIMDWADDVAYSVHDLEDWVRAGYMPISQLVNDAATRARYTEWYLGYQGVTDRDEADEIEKEVTHLFTLRTGPFVGFLRATPGGDDAADPASDAASHAIRVLRGLLFGEFLGKASLVRRATATPSAPRRYMLELDVPRLVRLRNKLLKNLLWCYVVSDHRMATQQHGQQHVVTELVCSYARAAMEGTPERLALFPQHTRSILEDGERSPDEKLRAVIDHVSSMTDAYAASRHDRLFGGTARLHDFA